jgi:serine/threonine protein kinase
LKVESEPIVYPADLPKDAVDFIDKLLKKDPEERIKNEELLQHPFLAKV